MYLGVTSVCSYDTSGVFRISEIGGQSLSLPFLPFPFPPLSSLPPPLSSLSSPLPFLILPFLL